MLLQRAKSAVFWSGADVVLKQGLQVGISIALARLLLPEEFGTVALLYLFVAIAGAFVDSGLSTALVQTRETTLVDESTVFWFNLVVSVAVAAVLWLAAPAIATFYRLSVLVPLTRVMALNLVIVAVGAIHGTLLSKRLDFRSQMKISAVSTVCSGTVAVVMAWKGLGVGALVVQTVVGSLTTTALLWLVSSWRPAWVFSFSSARRLFGFGGYLLAAVMLDTLYNRLYTVLIGRFFSTRDLGFYERANSTQQMPAGLLGVILGRVCLPIFSEAAGDKAKLQRGVRLTLRSTMLINVPMMLGLAVTAKTVVLSLFGERWAPAIPALQVLCLGGLFMPLHGINLSVLMAQGHSQLYFRLEVMKKPLGIISLLIGALGGTVGIAWAVASFGMVGFAINTYYTRRHLNYGVLDQGKDILPIVAACIPMLLSLYLLDRHWSAPAAMKLIIELAIGAGLFFTVSWGIRLNALRDIVALWRGRGSAVAEASET